MAAWKSLWISLLYQVRSARLGLQSQRHLHDRRRIARRSPTVDPHRRLSPSSRETALPPALRRRHARTIRPGFGPAPSCMVRPQTNSTEDVESGHSSSPRLEPYGLAPAVSGSSASRCSSGGKARLRQSGAVAQPARQADADPRPLQVEPVGIDHLAGMGDAAAHRHDMHRRAARPSAPPGASRCGRSTGTRRRRAARRPAPARAPGVRERGVHHPARAGAADSGRTETRPRRSAWTRCRPDRRAGRRTARRARPAAAASTSRWHACSKRHAEPRRQRLHVVAQRAGRGEERRVGHQQRAGDVVQQADADQHRRLPATTARPRASTASTASRASSSASWNAIWKPRLSRGSVSDSASAARRRVVAAQRAVQRLHASPSAHACGAAARRSRGSSRRARRRAPRRSPRPPPPASGKWLARSSKKSRASSFGSRMRRPEGSAMPPASSRATRQARYSASTARAAFGRAAGELRRPPPPAPHRRPAADRRTPRAGRPRAAAPRVPDSAARSTRSVSASLISSEAVTARWSCSIRFR